MLFNSYLQNTTHNSPLLRSTRLQAMREGPRRKPSPVEYQKPLHDLHTPFIQKAYLKLIIPTTPTLRPIRTLVSRLSYRLSKMLSSLQMTLSTSSYSEQLRQHQVMSRLQILSTLTLSQKNILRIYPHQGRSVRS